MFARRGHQKHSRWAGKKENRTPHWRTEKGRTPPKLERVEVLRGFFFIAAGIIVARLFIVMVLQNGFYRAAAEGQHELYQSLQPERGVIAAQDPYAPTGTAPIADNQELMMMYAIPRDIQDPADTAKKIAPILAMQPQEIFDRINKPGDVYEPILHKISDVQVEAIEKLDISGIYFAKEDWRFYPEKNLTSHITGFVGFSENGERIGQYGIEQYFDKELSGQQGFLQTEQDGAGRWITVGDHFVSEAQDGYNIILTIDKNVQHIACTKLREAVIKHQGEKGTVIIMNPKTGAVIAMCNYPDFDPNEYNSVEDIETFFNSAVSEEWEPGSVFKTFTLGAALDQGKITPETLYHDNGFVYVANYPRPIRNSDGRAQDRDVSMTFVLQESLNTGAIFAQQLIGNEKWYEYVKKWGFGQKTGIELTGENAGNVSNLETYKDIYAATSTFGQGIQVTPIQLVSAFASIANNGTLMKPYIVDEMIFDNGYTVETQVQQMQQVLSPSTAQTLSAMLVSAVDFGHAKGAKVPGYYIGGKTGTAQIAKSDGTGYDGSRHNDTFVGFGPISDPQFVMLTKINEPKDVPWAEYSVVPLFGGIADWLVDYYQIPPDREEE